MSYNGNPYDDYANSNGSSGLVRNHTISNYVIKTSLENLKAQELLKTETQALLEAIKDEVDTIDPIEFPNIPSALVSTDRLAIYRVDDSKYTLSYSTLLSKIETSLGESVVPTATYNAFVATIGSAANQEASYFATASALATLSSNVDLKANAADVYTQTQLDVSLGLKANSADVYTQSELDTALALKANQATTYTKAETDAAIAALVDSAPGTLDTLNELAAALGDDPNFATTIAAQIGAKQDPATTLSGYGITDAYTQAEVDALITGLNLGTAAESDIGDFATAAQGALADTALQNAAAFATAAQGAKADSAIQPNGMISSDADNGLSHGTDGKVYLDISGLGGGEGAGVNDTIGNNSSILAGSSRRVGLLETAIDTKADSADVYTSTETDSEISSAVSTAITSLVDGAPAGLDTLNEIAAAIGDDPAFATTIAALIAAKQDPATTLAGYGITDAYTDTEVDGLITALALGTASTADTGDFATAAQGALADTALQDDSVFATSAQGTLADTALQPDNVISEDANNGLIHGADGLAYFDNTVFASYTTDIVFEARTGNNPVETSNFNFVANGPRHMVDTTAGVISGTLPGDTPETGTRCLFGDVAGFKTNKLTVVRNGNLIGGLAEDCDVTTNDECGGFVFIGGSTGWLPFKG